MEMECGKEVQDSQISMKASTLTIRRAAMVYLLGQAEILIRGTTSMMFVTATEKCTGMMGVVIRAIGRKASNMEKVNFCPNPG
jgi:hypothetical protein